MTCAALAAPVSLLTPISINPGLELSVDVPTPDGFSDVQNKTLSQEFFVDSYEDSLSLTATHAPNSAAGSASLKAIATADTLTASGTVAAMVASDDPATFGGGGVAPDFRFRVNAPIEYFIEATFSAQPTDASVALSSVTTELLHDDPIFSGYSNSGLLVPGEYVFNTRVGIAAEGGTSSVSADFLVSFHAVAAGEAIPVPSGLGAGAFLLALAGIAATRMRAARVP